jgi:hypothetical protein
MAQLIHSLISEYLPAKKRQNAKGWWIFDAPCCQYRGHNKDIRSRGNLLFTPNGDIHVNCYNCGFKTRFSGNKLGNNMELFLGYLGVPRAKIQEAKLHILANTLEGENKVDTGHAVSFSLDFPSMPLPDHSVPLLDVISNDTAPEDAVSCAEYVLTRGRAVACGWQFYWSPTHKNDLHKRIIIPFYWHNRIVGWTGRYAGKPPRNAPKYFNSDLPTNYMFNADILFDNFRKFVPIVEGPLDAIAINGLGALGSTLNQSQIKWLNSIDKEKIIVPDREGTNQDLIDTALRQNWCVSFPTWEDDIKDAADASKKYGKLYTIASILHAKTNSKLQIELKRKLFKG